MDRRPAVTGLAEWLLQQIDADERTARESIASNEPDEPWGYAHIDGDGPHIANWSPGRVLAECDAKRRTLAEHHDMHAALRYPGEDPELALPVLCARCEDRARHEPGGWPCSTVRLLALPYADRPGYREEWRA